MSKLFHPQLQDGYLVDFLKHKVFFSFLKDYTVVCARYSVYLLQKNTLLKCVYINGPYIICIDAKIEYLLDKRMNIYIYIYELTMKRDQHINRPFVNAKETMKMQGGTPQL